jgi:hypothetical protein
MVESLILKLMYSHAKKGVREGCKKTWIYVECGKVEELYEYLRRTRQKVGFLKEMLKYPPNSINYSKTQ